MALRNSITIIILLWESLFVGDSWGFSLPSYAIHPPKDHFVGISPPADSIHTAKRLAIADATDQILGSIDSQISSYFGEIVKGTPYNPKRLISSNFKENRQGIVLDVERSIVRSDCIHENDRFVCFVLVRYPQNKIERMRTLSKGAKVTLEVVQQTSDSLTIRVTEHNGVEVLLTDLDIRVQQTNRYASLISYYVVHVPKSSSRTIHRTLGFKLKGNSRTIKIPLTSSSIGDIFLGAECRAIIRLKGTDELGRDITLHTSARFK